MENTPKFGGDDAVTMIFVAHSTHTHSHTAFIVNAVHVADCFWVSRHTNTHTNTHTHSRTLYTHPSTKCVSVYAIFVVYVVRGIYIYSFFFKLRVEQFN